MRGIGALRQFNQVDLDVVPTVAQLERQRADERTDLGRAGHAAGAEPTTNVPVVQHLQ